VVDGFLQQRELIQYIIASDAVCLPFELLPSDVPLSILEAMALGQGVITTRVACIPELVGKDRGFLVPPASADSLAQKLKAIATTPGLARRRGQRARAYVETHRTWIHMGQVLERVLAAAYDG
jgi:glycosyltransferase involved in cell wall biosynthesis